MITQKELKTILHYNQKTGIFTWRVDRGSNKLSNKIAGSIHKGLGYTYISINKKRYRAHILAWLYVYNEIPNCRLDHKNRNRSDNRISNLRKVSNAENSINARMLCNNTSGVKGVIYIKRKDIWAAKVEINNKQYVKYSKCFTEAVCYRLAMEQCLGWDKINTKSSAYLYVKELQNEKRKTKRSKTKRTRRKLHTTNDMDMR